MDDDEFGDRASQHDIQPPETGAVIWLGAGDRRGLHHDDPVKLQALGDGGRHNIDLVLDIAVVGS